MTGPSRSAHRRALSYIDTSREFYAAQGYEHPYQWAAHDTTPFHPLGKQLSDAVVGVVTTAFPHGSTRPTQAIAVPSQPVPDSLFTADRSWHKEATHTDDIDTFLPLRTLSRATDRIGGVSDRFYCVPTQYSQGLTKKDAAKVESWCREDGVDVVMLIPL
jgi:D-proline reductase (dithiol) PrdB